MMEGIGQYDSKVDYHGLVDRKIVELRSKGVENINVTFAPPSVLKGVSENRLYYGVLKHLVEMDGPGEDAFQAMHQLDKQIEEEYGSGWRQELLRRETVGIARLYGLEIVD
jgi:hypothetical protein